MPAPKGNDYWRKRIGVNTKKYTPEELAEKAIEYFLKVESEPYLKKDFKGKDSQEVYYELTVPFTEEGLCEHLVMHPDTWRNYKKGKGTYKDYFEVSGMICNAIKKNKLEGAMMGLYNASIIARDLGLSDKKDHTISEPEKKPDYDNLTPEEKSIYLDLKLKSIGVGDL